MENNKNRLHKQQKMGMFLIACSLLSSSSIFAMETNKRFQFIDYCDSGNIDACLKILDEIPDINSCITTHTRTLVHYACLSGHKKVLERLIEKGANLDCSDVWQQSPLHLACQLGHLSIVETLITRMSSINTQEALGRTPLYMATYYNRLPVVQTLLKHRADANCANNDGFTPLHIALGFSFKAIADLLLEYGADATCKTKWGETPLDIAIARNYTDITNLLYKTQKNLARLASFIAINSNKFTYDQLLLLGRK